MGSVFLWIWYTSILLNKTIISLYVSNLSNIGIGAAIIRTEEFNTLVKGGVPDSFRGYIWKLCSGAINRALVAPESYHVLKERFANQHSTHTEAIDRVSRSEMCCTFNLQLKCRCRMCIEACLNIRIIKHLKVLKLYKMYSKSIRGTILLLVIVRPWYVIHIIMDYLI